MITVPGGIFNFNEKDFIDNIYIKDSYIEEIFVINKTTNLYLINSIKVVDYLTLLFKGKFIIPKNKYRKEFSKLLAFLSKRNKLFIKYSRVILTDYIIDCAGRYFDTTSIQHEIFSLNILHLIDIYTTDNLIFIFKKIKYYLFNKYPYVNYIFSCNQIIFDDDKIKFSFILKCSFSIINTEFINRKKINLIVNKEEDLYVFINNISFDSLKPVNILARNIQYIFEII